MNEQTPKSDRRVNVWMGFHSLCSKYKAYTQKHNICNDLIDNDGMK